MKTVKKVSRENYDWLNRHTERTISNKVQHFKETESSEGRVSLRHHRGVYSADNITAIGDNVAEDTELLILRRSYSLGHSYDSLPHILHKDFLLYPYKIQLTRELTPKYIGHQKTYADWML